MVRYHAAATATGVEFTSGGVWGFHVYRFILCPPPPKTPASVAPLCALPPPPPAPQDLCLIHWPGVAKTSPTSSKNAELRWETWRVMEEYYRCAATMAGSKGWCSGVLQCGTGAWH